MQTKPESKIDIPMLLADVDACVACGMCLPSCPTYQQSREEAESPRGRVSLIKGLVTGELQATDSLVQHLDHCLSCRTCERICPAKVPFGSLMDRARYFLQVNGLKKSPVIFPGLSSQKKMGHSFKALKWADRFGLRGVVKVFMSSTTRTALGILPQTGNMKPLEECYPVTGPQKGKVALFTGCIARYVDRETIDAAIQLLNTIGYEVSIPENQQCCGAMDLHSGRKEQSDLLRKGNEEVFADDEFQAVIGLASGCTSTLKEYEDSGFSGKVEDIIDFLVKDGGLKNLLDSTWEGEVVLHIPCTQRNVLRNEQNIHKLLTWMPGLKVSEIPRAVSCCGAAGTYMIEQPEIAGKQRDVLLSSIPANEKFLLTTNIGCAMFIAKGLEERGDKVYIKHPVVLLAEHIKKKPT